MTTLESPARATTAASNEQTPTPAAIVIEDLAKQYGDFTAVNDVTLTIETGEVFGLLGPNGAGKTTTIDLIVGLREATSGSVRVLGLDPVRDRAAFTARVAVQPQEANLYDTLTVRETLTLFASFHDAPRPVQEMAELIGLDDQLKVRAKRLSGGQRRRLLLGVALIGDPDVVVLDEPSAGLDPSARHELWDLISSLRGRGTTVLLTTHHMDEASALCDRVAIMVDGGIVAIDAPDELVRARSQGRRVTFTVPAGTDLAALDELGVTDIAVNDTAELRRVAVSTTDADELVVQLAQRGIRTRDLAIETQSLEDVFLELASTSDYSSRITEPRGKGRKNR
ncbi:ABC transporter ATP-binding protein [Gulosibacter sp. ACHW.36C]|uniref:ABC transporter ATP-binding protein n=1 Tax=Gulosibacter sediminis TaxID=1729695 RepID=A0ABY4MX72_9MICO|nr:ABC transporter ATP-binding protein [Gulosibacter sediminis]UQN14979.1 ABC transporter ATP-binding protein [Gulosibacter sediminis]